MPVTKQGAVRRHTNYGRYCAYPGKWPCNLLLTAETSQKLTKRAEHEGLSRSDLAEKALREYLERNAR